MCPLVATRMWQKTRQLLPYALIPVMHTLRLRARRLQLKSNIKYITSKCGHRNPQGESRGYLYTCTAAAPRHRSAPDSWAHAHARLSSHRRDLARGSERRPVFSGCASLASPAQTNQPVCLPGRLLRPRPALCTPVAHACARRTRSQSQSLNLSLSLRLHTSCWQTPPQPWPRRRPPPPPPRRPSAR